MVKITVKNKNEYQLIIKYIDINSYKFDLKYIKIIYNLI